MIYKMKTVILLIFLFCLIVKVQPGIAESKFRVGYLEGGQYWVFSEVMDATKANLEKMGWKDKIEFPKDANFSPGWTNKTELETRAKELMSRKDIDIIIAAGSGATDVLLKANNNRTPLISMAVADPIRSKFVVNEKDSGVDNYTTRVDPQAYERMFSIFHDVAKFKKLGIMYSNLPTGRTIANVDDAYKIAKERGFSILEYEYDSKRSETTKPEDICLEGLRTLVSQGMDAFFIPALSCFDWTKSDVGKLVNFLSEQKIPTFARDGAKYVKAGALMGCSSTENQGIFFADRIIRILKGEKPRSLSMKDNNAIPKISINLVVAKKIGFELPSDLLISSDEIFKEITLPPERLVK